MTALLALFSSLVFRTTILGLQCNASQVAPNTLLSQAGSRTQKWQWWQEHRISIPKLVLHDLFALAQLVSNDASDPVWTQYMGYLIPREATAKALQDATYEGLGVRCPPSFSCGMFITMNWCKPVSI